MNTKLPIIVIAQFFCTSAWFAVNAVMKEILVQLNIPIANLAHLTTAVQLGFILGTLVFASLSIADRYSPSKVFFVSALLGALFNLGILIPEINFSTAFAFRVATGFFLAGIYPVGMKIAADYFQAGLGKSLGFLVGALVLGTAFPHLLKSLSLGLNWSIVLLSTSALSVIGGLCIFVLVPDGPYRKAGQGFQLNAFLSGFKIPEFRSAAIGYFGHMWELYAFWTFLPLILERYLVLHPILHFSVSFWSFCIIATGFISCAAAGIASQKRPPRKIALLSLMVSGVCCLLTPLMVSQPSTFLLFLFLFTWGFSVVADSPMFSTLIAGSVPNTIKGSSLTIVNCIGFSITIVSIQLLRFLIGNHHSIETLLPLLAIGPIVGIATLVKGTAISK